MEQKNRSNKQIIRERKTIILQRKIKPVKGLDDQGRTNINASKIDNKSIFSQIGCSNK